MGVAHEDVVGPAGALQEHLFPVEYKLPVAVRIVVGSDIPDAEGQLVRIGDLAVFCQDFDGKVVELGIAETAAPPEAGIVKVELRSFFGRDGHFAALVRCESYGNLEGPVFKRPPEQAFYGLVREVSQGR